jgi:hypothetical protein
MRELDAMVRKKELANNFGNTYSAGRIMDDDLSK